MGYRGLIGPGIAMLVPYLLFELLRRNDKADVILAAPTGHFYVVSSVAILSTVMAILIGIAGNRLRNCKVSFLALAFISLAEMFSVHGLSTPNFLLHSSQMPGMASQLSILLAAFWLWLSSLPSDNHLVLLLSKRKERLVPAWACGLGLFGLLGMMFPHSADVISLNKYPLQIVAMCVTIFLLVLTMRSYYQSYRYSRFPLQIAIVYSGGWLIISQLIIVMGTTWRLSWWIYHFLMLFSMLVMIAGLMKQYAARGSITSAVRSLFSSDPIERITSNISPSVKALIMATESRDTYTAGHNFRVTIFALHLAEEMGVNPEQLRALAQGAIVHDVGKINVPDSVLNKAGKLTEDERSIIEMHPIIGYNMCKSLGFMKDELSIIRSHHERWNGTGYPDRLQGEEIPILARITAVADVYDALTSTRSYRQAWTHEAAMKLLQGDKGSHFDPACVDAWERVCERDPRVYRVTADEMETGVGLPSLKQASHSKVG